MRSPILRENISQLNELGQVKCGWITQVRWSPIGDMLAVASADRVRLYGGGSESSYVLEGHSGHVKGVAFSPDGKLLASVSADMTVRVWNLAEEIRLDKTLEGHTDSVDAVVFSPDGTLLASAGTDQTVRLWDVTAANGTQKAVLQGHTAEISGLTFALGGKMLVSGSRDNTVRLWDIPSETTGTILGEHDDWIREVATNPPGTMIASAGKDTTVCLWDAYAEERYARIIAHLQGVDAVAFNPNGKLLATGGRDHLIRIWSIDHALQKGEIPQEDALIALQGHEKPVMSLAFNLAGTMLASGSGDNTVRLWGIP